MNKIRKAANGEMLLEFRSKTHLIEQNFTERLQEALNNVVQVKTLCKEITFECHSIFPASVLSMHKFTNKLTSNTFSNHKQEVSTD